MIPGWYEKLLQLIMDLEERFPELDFAQINKEVDNLGQTIFSYDSVKAALTNIMPVVFNTSISLVKMIVNALIALMVSCYLLIDKKIISANFKKLIEKKSLPCPVIYLDRLVDKKEITAKLTPVLQEMGVLE